MDWRIELGFTDRLRAIQSLTAAHQQTASSSAFAEAQAKARQCETEAYEKATSKEAYDQLCQQAIDNAERAFKVTSTDCSTPERDDIPILKENPDSSTERYAEGNGGETIGAYTSCTPCFDGLHSTIYKSHAEDGTVCAVKVTTPHLMTAPHDTAREIRLLHEASSENVVTLVETFNLDGGRMAMVFPFIKYDLAQLLQRDMVTATQIRSILRDLFKALQHIHHMGILHRDIKTSNILMDSPDGPAYLADFGIAWKEDDPGSEPKESKITDVGTTHYRAPELLFGYKAYGPSLDLWAAGCVVGEAIAVGHRPLFDSGPLGSDLSLVHSIFSTLGTPDESVWPDVEILPDWGKVEFFTYPPRSWQEILPAVSSKGRDLVSRLVRYQGSERLSAEELKQCQPAMRFFSGCNTHSPPPSSGEMGSPAGIAN
ncbi:hypothetical protein N7539_002449 [Penicillium diatomitis]|uniref:cyclin-dependent kinase n=1 Tax=Penicillium diatomitis TaxID=2819901 RepID=A0A9W9XFY3_9EURO|nr:uncharacterized protein N7539_002449 [Penicillium diatomitis]KAJ5490882.1 hypothetical protein N7539_002449 [Penicillium diatomitis]